MSLTSASAELVSQAGLPLEIQHTVTSGIPLLLPNMVVAAYQVELVDDANGFVVDYVSSAKAATVVLATSQPRMPALGSSGRRSTRAFRGGVATYQIDSSAATAARWLYWNEPGAKGMTPYSLLSDGLSESEFWQLAGSLQPIGSGPLRECTASDLHTVTGPGNGASGQIFNTIWFSNHSPTPCQLDGTPTIQLRAPSGSVITLPQNNSLMPWMTAPPSPAVMAPNSPDPQPGSMATTFGEAIVDFSMWDCPADPAFSEVLVGLPHKGGTLTVSAAGIGYSYGAQCEPTGHVAVMGVAPFVGTAPEPNYVVGYPLSVRLKVPATVKTGQTLHYQVVMTNTSGAPFRFQDCPSYTEDASRPGAKMLANYELNCQPVGWVAPNASLTFEMVFQVPSSAPIGNGSLRWELRSTYGGAQVEMPLGVVQ